MRWMGLHIAISTTQTAFQKDRERQNLLAANGYLVFRTFAKEVFDEVSRAKLVELIAAAYLNHKEGI